jgi:hypothetical protein
MATIKNIQPLSAEALFDLLKKEFTAYLNTALGANMSVDYAHVSDIINIHFPEITEGIVFSLTVSDDDIELSRGEIEEDYNTELLEQHLINFLTLKAE